MRKVILLLALVLSSLELLAQGYPVYNQYFNNPFLINPAFVGTSGYVEANATHRRQWMGIEDAPITTTLNIQYPTKTSVALGLSFASETSAFLRRSALMATFGYRVDLGENHNLRFGLSGGAGNYFLDPVVMNDGNSDDVALLGMLGSSYFMDGQFGVAYNLKGLKLGFALPRLFDNKVFEKANLKDVRYAQLHYNLFSASYRINFSYSGFAFEPYVLYRMGEGITQQWEGLGTFYIKNLVWVGGSYRQNFGAAFFGGVNIKNFKFGYAYEIPTSSIAQYTSGTHELQLSIRFGKDKNAKPKKKSIIKEIKTAEVKKEPVKKEEPKPAPQVEKVEEPVTSPAPVEELTEPEPEVKIEEKKIEEKESTHPLELKEGNYVVVGVFKMVRNSENFQKQLKATGFNTNIGYSSKSGMYYVYLSQYQDVDDARSETYDVRQLEGFEKAWIMTVE